MIAKFFHIISERVTVKNQLRRNGIGESIITNIFPYLKSIRKWGMICIASISISLTSLGQKTWDGGAGNLSWSAAANWNPDGVPGAADVVLFNTGTSLVISDVLGGVNILKLQVTNNSNITLRPPTTNSRVINVTSATNDAILVAAGSTLVIAGRDAAPDRTLTLTTSNTPGLGADIDGTLKVALDNNQVNAFGAFTKGASATINFNANSIYEHAVNGGTIPTATWNAISNCKITGITTATSIGGFGQTFGNFIWDCPNMNTTSGSDFYIASDVNILGDFTISGTGLPQATSDKVLRMSGNAGSYTINVGGNFLITNSSTFKMNNSTGSCILNVGGNFTMNNNSYITIVTGNANSTINVTGNVDISSGATLCMDEDASPRVGTLNVQGNFNFSGGTITQVTGGSGAINFNRNGTQVYSRSGGTISNIVNFSVLSNSVLDVGTSIIDGSTGNFTLNSGAGIITAHQNGLSTTTGSIRVTGTQTYYTGADYTYNGSVAQTTGNGLPNTVRNLTTNNSSGVSLTNGVTVDGTQTLTSGALNLNGKALSISATGLVSCAGTGTINGNAGSSFTITSNTATGFPRGTYQDVTINS
ncbi:MAG: hypothetical protein NT092_07135, partial [Bacteroidia bacterium]|nr:hypothetical protein [Bacteroidia bacterium]